jgi:DNA replication and repair protein RecF
LQRASFLKTGDVEKFPEELDAWDMQLVFLGKQIINSRKKFISEISPIVNSINKKISGGSEEIELIYEPNVTEEDFEKTLAATRARDIRMRENHVGPHRDDLSILINDLPARNYGSQGQQRSAALALKLGEAAVIRNFSDEQPVALLDDVMSELDAGRQNYILNHIFQTNTP